MSTEMASRERQRGYERWVIRNAVIEECVMALEPYRCDSASATSIAFNRIINEFQSAIRALKD